MTNLSLVSPDGVSENQVIRSNVAKTQQPDAERLTSQDMRGQTSPNFQNTFKKLFHIDSE